jgi:hypothetical protein
MSESDKQVSRNRRCLYTLRHWLYCIHAPCSTMPCICSCTHDICSYIHYKAFYRQYSRKSLHINIAYEHLILRMQSMYCIYCIQCFQKKFQLSFCHAQMHIHAYRLHTQHLTVHNCACIMHMRCTNFWILNTRHGSGPSTMYAYICTYMHIYAHICTYIYSFALYIFPRDT